MGEIRDGVFYNDAITTRKPRAVIAIAGRAVRWLGIVAWIARNRGTSTDICATFDIHRTTLTGYMRDIEQVYGVVIRYHWPDKRSAGWYVIDEWGVIDRAALLERFRTSKDNPNF